MEGGRKVSKYDSKALSDAICMLPDDTELPKILLILFIMSSRVAPSSILTPAMRDVFSIAAGIMTEENSSGEIVVIGVQLIECKLLIKAC